MSGVSSSGSSPSSGSLASLRVLGIAASTYYGWVARRRRPSQRQLDDAVLLERIRAVHERSGGTYGAPRVHAQLRRDGIRVGRKRVERLMRQHALQGAFLRKRWRAASTRQDPRATPAPDLVNRQFTATAPGRLWVADISRIPTAEGALWLASIRDAYSRRIVGWKVADRATTDLVLGALEYALWGRQVERNQLIHHADRGCQYTAIRLAQRLTDAGIRPRWGRSGTRSTTPWPKTSSPSSRSSVSTAAPTAPGRRQSSTCSPTSTAGTTPTASNESSVG